ncbi:MAG: RHS repeat domain-containing protein, partial [Pyrinomonadaceae bacterium]
MADCRVSLDTTKNNGQLGRIDGFIGTAKQWTQKFQYDSIGRLKQAAEYRGDNSSLTYKQVFDFDRFGNLYRKAANNPTTGQANPLPYTPIEDSDISKSTNRFTTDTTYNEAGMVTSDDKFRDMGFSYDANGRMVKATRSQVPDALTVYDALGNRVASTVNDVWRFSIYDAFGKLVAEYGQADEGIGGVKYVQQDWQGSVRTVSNSNGFVISRTDHSAFGETVGAGIGLRSTSQGYWGTVATRQGYGLTERDEATGLDHTWFRKNEGSAGRWTSPDPYKGSMDLDDPQSFNRYSYVLNQPTNFVDPSGL